MPHSCNRGTLQRYNDTLQYLFPDMMDKMDTSLRLFWPVVLTVCLLAVGCTQTVRLRGQTTDISGQALPGVVVRVAGTDSEALSTVTGHYSLRAAPAELHLEFFKTGYTPVHITVSTLTTGAVEIAPVSLWPLPMGEGVFLFQHFRYHQADHPRVNRYRVENMGIVFGTTVEPQLAIDWVDPDETPAMNPPLLIAHKLPPYDARMHKLQQVKAAPAPLAGMSVDAPPAKQPQYTETVWIAEEPVPLRARPIDEPEKLLVELRAAQALAPGAYAIHWGALEGYDSIDPRVFLFTMVPAPEPETPSEGEGEETPEKENQ